MKKLSNILWGIVLIALGVVLAVNAFDIVDVDVFFDGWWTLFIIIPSVIGIITEKKKTGNFITLGIGVLLLLSCQKIIDIDIIWKLIIPIGIVLVGIKLIFSDVFSAKEKELVKKIRGNTENLPVGTAVFSGKDMNFSGEPFNGTDLVAIFGGVECDLKEAEINNDCVIKATAVFGGIDIALPANVNVKVNSNSIFGGISDKAHRNSKDNAVTVYIEGVCVFGGVDIK